MKYIMSKIIFFVSLMCYSLTYAGTVDISGFDSSGGITRGVLGVWSHNDRISFSEPGLYSIELYEDSASSFEYLSAYISTPTELVASYRIEGGEASFSGPLRFEVDSDTFDGEYYWLNILAITDSTLNYGVFGLNIAEYTPIPVPPAFLFMFSAIFGLVAYGRKKTAF